MTLLRRWTLAVVAMVPLTCAGCGGSGPEPEAPRPGAAGEAVPDADAVAKGQEPPLECEGPPVTLSLDWPADLKARVQSLEVVEIRDSREEDPARQALETRHRMGVAPVEAGLRVTFRAMGDGRPRLDGFLLEYGGERADLVISKDDGTVLALEGLEAMRAAHDDVRRESGLGEREAEALVARFEPNVLRDEVRGWWNLILSGWVGRTIGCDEAQTTEGSTPVWALGGAEVPMSFEWRYLGSEPCAAESGRGDRQCVELAVVGRADSDETRRLHEERIRAVEGDRAEGLTVQRAELVRLVQVRMEPEGMILHGIRAEEHVGSAFELPDGEVAGRRQSEGHAVIFQYGSPDVQWDDEPGEPGGAQPREVR
jgi:hypothetical protein